MLRFLAATQATAHRPEADAEPGKILHETRQGEMARSRRGAVRPLLRRVDATPLFVMLAGHVLRAHRRSRHVRGDLAEPARRRWAGSTATAIATATASSSTSARPRAASSTRAGRIRRTRSSTPTAGSPKAPIALCEVQGYVFAAKRHAAAPRGGARRRGSPTRSRGEAAALRSASSTAFWCEELGTYALALDGAKQPVPGAHLERRPCPALGHRGSPSARAGSRRR